MTKPAKTRSSRAIELPDGQACFAVFELSRIFHVQRSRILDLIDEGELAAFDLRGKNSSRVCIRVPRQSVLEFLENGSVHAHSKKPQIRIMNRR